MTFKKLYISFFSRLEVLNLLDGPCYQGAMHFRDGADASTEYEYDKNGNMTKDLNKGIAGIEYNSLNLPLNIRHNNGNMEHYTYSAAGTKLCTTSRTLSVGVLSPMTGVMQQSSAVSPRDGEIHFTYYCGNVIYDGNVTRILTDEGYVTFNGTTPVYHYYLKDHLGNNRVVLGQNGAVEQVNHYYPFGGLMGESIGGSTQPYKYNGKELDRANGLDWCDYGARWYDATRTGWTSVDPLCEKYYNVSPYVYCVNNPVNAIDHDGRDVLIWYTDRKGKDNYIIYDGTQRCVPNNTFVLDFIHTYNFLKSRNAGKNVVNAVTKHDILIEVQESYKTEYDNSDRRKTVFWQPRKGLKTSKGGKQSPATRLEHEFDHGIDDIKDSGRHRHRKEKQDERYDNREERRVITGSETDTARKLGESVRYDHGGTTYDVVEPTTTK